MHRRTDNVWPLYVTLQKDKKAFGQWQSVQWQLKDFISATEQKPEQASLVFLELFLDERASYRLNLDLDEPRLFVVCDELDNGQWQPMSVTAEQSIASACLESDTPVLSLPMPTAIACWIEGYITRHGEVSICAHRRKHVDRQKEMAEDRQRGKR